MTGVIMAAVVVGLIGLLIGLLLGFAAKAFAVPVDEKEIEVREFLPGSTCKCVSCRWCSSCRKDRKCHGCCSRRQRKDGCIC